MLIEELRSDAVEAINKSRTPSELGEVRIKYLGRNGELTQILRSLKDKSVEEKRDLGSKANAFRLELEQLFSEREKELALEVPKLPFYDLTKPGNRISRGHLHPLSLVQRDIYRIFSSMNFSVAEGPELENEYYNFDALNIPVDHPARDMWDTFWIKEDPAMATHPMRKKHGRLLLRTHTSPVQIRYMETHTPPFRIIAPGRTFRYEATDASHETNFYQLESLVIGSDITLANLKYTVIEFFKAFFKRKIDVRFRPSYFPFVEPGLEVDIRWGNKWLEVMGAGMVHRNVLKGVKYDPNMVQGFAFGCGVERLAILKYKIPDIRLFYSSDLRFIRQFS